MNDFNFMSEEEAGEIATGGNPKDTRGAITEDIKKEAIRLAESPEGLDIESFQRKYKIHVMNVDEILKG